MDVVNDDDSLSADHVALLDFPPLPLFPCTTSILTINILSPGFQKKTFNLFEIFGKCCKAFECCCWGYICIEATRERKIIVWDTRRMFFFYSGRKDRLHSARWKRQIPLGPLTPMEIEMENGQNSVCVSLLGFIYFFYVKIFLLTVTKFSWIYSALCTSHGLISPDSGTSYYS